jgi:squalene synthase HpnC
MISTLMRDDHGSRLFDGDRQEHYLRSAGGENFPVAMRFLPHRYRKNLSVIYNFARLLDDAGDEAPEKDRPALLDLIEEETGRVFSGTARFAATRALAETVAECAIPADPFYRLIEANRRDQIIHDYQTFDELLDYCAFSANPVGRIVLHVFGVATADRFALSDSVCTALQLAEHWQDVAEDRDRGRVYLPREDRDRFGCTDADLAAAHTGPKVRELMTFECDRAARMLDDGARLVGTLRGAARLAVAGYVAGGRTALAAIARAGHDVLAGPPRASRARLAGPALRTLILGR